MRLQLSRHPELIWVACLSFSIATMLVLRHFKLPETAVIVSAGVVAIGTGLILGSYHPRDRSRE